MLTYLQERNLSAIIKFSNKTHSDGSIEHDKARLVAIGYSYKYYIDYEETFSLVAQMTSIPSLLAIAATKQWPLLQMDNKNMFLNGTLPEEVYMKSPLGTTPPPQKVCLLRHALYVSNKLLELGLLRLVPLLLNLGLLPALMIMSCLLYAKHLIVLSSFCYMLMT